MLKTALITGGTGGIGEAICRRLAAEGYTIIINYSRSHEKAEALAEELHGTALCFDVADSEKTADAIRNAGRIDLLVNNAGISEIELFTHITPEKAR